MTAALGLAWLLKEIRASWQVKGMGLHSPNNVSLGPNSQSRGIQLTGPTWLLLQIKLSLCEPVGPGGEGRTVEPKAAGRWLK